MDLIIQPAKRLLGKIRVPGDKSISHRAVMLGSLAKGMTEIKGFLMGEDCLCTIRCFRDLGIPIDILGDKIVITGKGLAGLKEPEDILNVGNSGTTIRLMSGILAGQGFTSIVTGDDSIRRRPMGRVTRPLKEMGAHIMGRSEGELAPYAIRGGDLKAITYQSSVASAQIKSAVLLAGLYASGWTEFIEPAVSRNHSELMLRSFGAQVESEGNTVRIKGGPALTAQQVIVPGDISSAAFFMIAGLIVPDSRIVLESIGLNPTRDGIIEVLEAMGARIRVYNTRIAAGELMGDIEIQASLLKGVQIGGSIIPRLIDEIPVLAVAGAFSQGVTEIRDAAELKVKESNRILAMAQGLSRMGVRIEELPDGLRIYGGRPLKGASCDSFKDHRIAMALAVAGLASIGDTLIKDADSIGISFPGFTELVEELR